MFVAGTSSFLITVLLFSSFSTTRPLSAARSSTFSSCSGVRVLRSPLKPLASLPRASETSLTSSTSVIVTGTYVSIPGTHSLLGITGAVVVVSPFCLTLQAANVERMRMKHMKTQSLDVNLFFIRVSSHFIVIIILSSIYIKINCFYPVKTKIHIYFKINLQKNEAMIYN